MGPSPSEFAALNQKLKNERRRIPKKTGNAAEASAAVDASGHPVVLTPPRPRGRPKKEKATELKNKKVKDKNAKDKLKGKKVKDKSAKKDSKKKKKTDLGP